MTDETQAQPEDGQQTANQNVPGQLDPQFFTVVNEFLELTNRQSQTQGLKRISMASLYATARFNSWVSACGFHNAADMKAAREETIEYFIDQYRLMLQENLDDYINNFEKYMTTVDDSGAQGKTRRELFDR